MDARGAPLTPPLRRAAAGAAVALAALAAPLAAHVGAPDQWFAGPAGPYAVRVLIRDPGVVPGWAEVVIRTPPGVAQVGAAPFFWATGPGGAPAPDAATAVPGEPGLWTVRLLFLKTGAYGVRVTIDGAAGRGEVTVPFAALPRRTLAMDPALGAVLGVLGLVLVGGAIAVIGAGSREGTLPPGERPDDAARVRGRRAMRRGAVALATGLGIVALWWRVEDVVYRRNLYRPWEAAARVEPGPAGGRVLVLEVTDPRWTDRARRDWAPLIPDHGKLVHAFLLPADGGPSLAHLHPVPVDSSRFRAALPPLPAGRWRLFAEFVTEDGLPHTAVASLALGAPDTAWAPGDADDAWHAGPAGDGATRRADLGDGARVRLVGPAAPVAGAEADLAFEVENSDGAPAEVEPYLGMAGHAVVAREDGAVFVHLHPAGTASAAAAAALTVRRLADTARGAVAGRLAAGDAHAVHAAHATRAAPARLPGSLRFPWAFPSPGRYRVWVQVKRGGAIRTAAFELQVAPGAPARG
ncbi:MAG: hypothetical protein NW201_00505 [Gemmatimonadales bacterium]|nr:hypothetical protein [Gemmatimonadales bacterium]